jgi:asparagine synthase (glutamine-hydrolysing)
MCGIAGIVHADYQHSVSQESIKAMCDRLVHRGPDHFGHYVQGQVGLGMRRLSIIDLETGEQPITNEDGTVWIVFNGEIYNYRSLRKDLEVKGHRFCTTSDTEVIVHLYEDMGQDCVQRLRGMFAFAIWDAKQRALMLARDRLGIKPLYYAETPDGLIFGSELKALLTHPAVPREISPEAMFEYFTHLCVPGDLSIFQSIRKLPPAHVLTYSCGYRSLTRYWHIQPIPDYRPTEEEWIEELRSRLRDAVESHLVADVPVGAFLSGGLDSGTMVALMAQASQEPVRTFTVGFAADAGGFDERVAARTVAERYGTDHRECLLEADVTLLPQIVSAFDEPFADSSAIPNWLVCQETARHVKVALSGLGADELFGGYERYVGLQLGEAYHQIPRLLRLAIANVISRLPAGDGISYRNDRLKRFVAAGELSLEDCYRSFITAFNDARTILHPDVSASLANTPHRYDQVIRDLTVHDALDLGLFTDLYLYLPDDLLPLSDRVSMAHSLEVRVPFLDHELVEFTARIPARLKVHGLQKKFIFRKAIAPWVPREHFTRPKQGFSVPIAAWLRGSLRPMLCDLVEGQAWRTSPWLNQNAIQQMINEHLVGTHNHESRLWAILCFREWERQSKAVPALTHT